MAISGNEQVCEVLRLMIAHNINHLVVIEDDRPVGMVRGHDLVVLQGHSALCLAREVDHQTDLAGLRQVLNQAQQLIPSLLRQGVRAGQLGWLMADINDRLVARVLAFTEAALGPPPVPYCWLLLGSEGRREQTFKTDQDNALIYADPSPELTNSARTYFLEFGRRAVTALVEVGFPPCASHCTADNPEWVQSLSGWRALFGHWVTAWKLEEVFQTLIFFDFRGIYGDLFLAEQLWRSIQDLLEQNPRYLTRLAHLAVTETPPISFLGQFTLEHHGEHKEELDLKLRGTMPIVELARFFALRHGLTETNTLSRLEQLKMAGHLPTYLADELAQAFEFMLSLRLQRQWEQIQAQQPTSNYINPNCLPVLDRTLLREAFKVIAHSQELLRKGYQVRVGRFYS
jgi:CBS domain-containing protein